MEDAPRLSDDPRLAGRHRPWVRSAGGLIRVGLMGAFGLGLAALVGPTSAPRVASGEDPAAELTAAVGRLGPPGTLWGRLGLEEESPDGPWTPLPGVDITVYPAVPSVVAELEKIRDSARGSGAEYESAVGRLQQVLAAHLTRAITIVHGAPQPQPPDGVEGGKAGAGKAPGPEKTEKPGFLQMLRPGPAQDRPGVGDSGRTDAGKGSASAGKPAGESTKSLASGRDPGGQPAPGASAKPGDRRDTRPEAMPGWKRTTDPEGLFVFDSIPSGDWLLVAIRVTPYGTAGGHLEVKKPSPSRTRNFLPSPTVAFKEAEVWLSRVRVRPGDRTALLLTDRARWLVGPIR
jgi:hypothetical protein